MIQRNGGVTLKSRVSVQVHVVEFMGKLMMVLGNVIMVGMDICTIAAIHGPIKTQ